MFSEIFYETENKTVGRKERESAGVRESEGLGQQEAQRSRRFSRSLKLFLQPTEDSMHVRYQGTTAYLFQIPNPSPSQMRKLIPYKLTHHSHFILSKKIEN